MTVTVEYSLVMTEGLCWAGGGGGGGGRVQEARSSRRSRAAGYTSHEVGSRPRCNKQLSQYTTKNITHHPHMCKCVGSSLAAPNQSISLPIDYIKIRLKPLS